MPKTWRGAGEGAARGDTVNLRGFSAFNDFFLDGIRDAAVYSRDTFDLMDEIEKTLALDTTPMTWPVGRGRDFLGTYDVVNGGVRLLEGGGAKTGEQRAARTARQRPPAPRARRRPADEPAADVGHHLAVGRQPHPLAEPGDQRRRSRHQDAPRSGAFTGFALGGARIG